MNNLAQFDAFGIDKAAHGFFHIRGVKRFDIGQSLLQRRQQLTSVCFANSFLKGLFVVAQIIVRYEEASPLGHTLFAVRSNALFCAGCRGRCRNDLPPRRSLTLTHLLH